jgi:hypothetical protein
MIRVERVHNAEFLQESLDPLVFAKHGRILRTRHHSGMGCVKLARGAHQQTAAQPLLSSCYDLGGLGSRIPTVRFPSFPRTRLGSCVSGMFLSHAAQDTWQDTP